jgi:C1A family cysteine protease
MLRATQSEAVMRQFLIGFVAAMSLVSVGCKKAGGGDDMLKKMTEMKEKMCKCGAGDSKCAQAVLDEWTKASADMAKSADKTATVDPDMQKKMEPVQTEMAKCQQTAMTPKTDAPAAAPSGSAAPAADEKKPDEKKPDVKEKKDDKGGW